MEMWREASLVMSENQISLRVEGIGPSFWNRAGDKLIREPDQNFVLL